MYITHFVDNDNQCLRHWYIVRVLIFLYMYTYKYVCARDNCQIANGYEVHLVPNCSHNWCHFSQRMTVVSRRECTITRACVKRPTWWRWPERELSSRTRSRWWAAALPVGLLSWPACRPTRMACTDCTKECTTSSHLSKYAHCQESCHTTGFVQASNASWFIEG